MGSTAEEIPVEDGNEEITVLVTGFGPFRAQNPINPSWEIAHNLPPFLPPLPSTSSTSLTSLTPPRVRILVHPSPIRVSYTTVRTLIPSLFTTPSNSTSKTTPTSPSSKFPDYILHIGMASGRKFYSIERRAHRDGYYMKDVDSLYLNDDALRVDEKVSWVWEGLPAELQSSLDVDDVWKRWRVNLSSLHLSSLNTNSHSHSHSNLGPNTAAEEGRGGEEEARDLPIDIRISEDAGKYLCDFIYYSTLAELEKKNQEKKVLFLHVPVEADEVGVKRGVDVTVELIRAMVVSGLMMKMGAEGDGAAEGKSGELR